MSKEKDLAFPRHLHQPKGRFVVVDRPDVCDQLLEAGWTLQPDEHVEKPVEVTLAAALAALDKPKGKEKK